MNLQKVKRLFFQIMIGCLIAAAGIAVVTVLAGSFNELLGKALFTIVLIAVHALISFGFISNNEKQETFENLSFFTNATFTIIVLSFITSVFGVWEILPGELVGKLYMLYFVLLFATLHGEVLAKMVGNQTSLDGIIYGNYFFMALVVLMLIPVIFAADASIISDFYYRILAAAGIVDATLTLVAVIMHKLYLQKHPKIVDPVFNAPLPAGAVQSQGQQPAKPRSRVANIFLTLLVGYIVLQLLSGLGLLLIASLGRR